MDVRHVILTLDYEAQHFGFHPRAFIDLVYNAYLENVLASLNHLKQHMMQEYILPPNVIHSLTDSMLQDLVTLCDKCIDKLEVYLNSNAFSINPYAVLPEDEVHVNNSCTKEEDENIDKEIEELKQRIREEKAKRYNLKKTINEQKQVKERLLYVQNELKYLLKIASEEGVNKESVELFYSKVNNLILEFSLKMEELGHTKGLGA